MVCLEARGDETSLLYSNWRRTAAGKVENPCVCVRACVRVCVGGYKQDGNPVNFKHAVRSDRDAFFRVHWIHFTPLSPALALFHFIFRGHLKRPIYETPV
jgi:hypothetical protein